ncbi:MAG: TonB-dependent receptor [Sphingomonadales bacterium]|nr:TonB-dependent receptor [Sphingomonadales bacterium]MBD3772861.1 TonB-dependent receptor [Paracoccaceae bacterium]
MRLHPPAATVSLFALSLAIASAAHAQDAPATQQADPAPTATDSSYSDDQIVVTAERIRGQVDSDQPPIVELDENDIASYGATSLEDLVGQLASETSSGRGRGGQPVFLINGQRVSGFREFRQYPPEAVRKVEVLPEEVALKFGYPADARVINIILKDDFASREIEAELGGPTDGGTTTTQLQAKMLKIKGKNRFNLSGDVQNTSLLTEAERGVIQDPATVPTVASDPDPADYRSLIAKSRQYQLEGTINRGLGENGLGGSISLNGSATRLVSTGYSGLDSVLLTDPGGATALRTLDDDPLARRTTSTTLALGSTLNKGIGDWQMTATVDATHVETTTLIDRRRDSSALVAAAAAGTLAIDGPLPTVASAGTDRSNNLINTVVSQATFNGNPIALSAGDVSVTFTTGFDWKRIESDDTRSSTSAKLTRRRLDAGVTTNIPIAERDGAWGAIGDLSLNAALGIENLSDFGTLGNYTIGLTWRPIEPLTLSATYIMDEQAPSLSNLGNPQVVTFNVPTYDFTRGETVLATITSGGNPNLKAETQRDIKLSASLDLGLFDRSNFRVEYFRNRSSDVTQSFPLLTPAIEAAFPDRVTRDANGQLIAIDRTPVTFSDTRSSRIRVGFNFFGKFGGSKTEAGGAAGGQPAGGAPAAGGPAPGGPAPGGAAFDPARFAQLREQFCKTEEGTVPDISTLPPQMQERLKGEDGKVDPAKVAAMRARFCSADGAPPQGSFDPARFAALRQALCVADKPGEMPDLSALPEQLRERLKGENGEIDPAKLAQLKQRVCAMPDPGQGGQPPAGQAGGQGGGPRGSGRGGGMGFGPPNDGATRWNLGFDYSRELTNTALIAPGIPRLNLLDGDALSGGGVSRDTLQVQGGLFSNGIGFRLSGKYASATQVDELHFGSLATLDLRMFVNLEQVKFLAGDNPGFLKGARFSLRVDNIFNTRQRVTDSTGTVPLSYQPALIDPVGRYLEVEFRKVF